MIKNSDILKFIKDEQTVYLANVVDNKAKVRAMAGIFYADHFWFATKKDRAKTEQFKNNNSIEICKSDDMGSIRVSGELNFIDNREIRVELSEVISFFEQYWSNPEDEDFILLKLIPNNVTIHDFSKVQFITYNSREL